MKIHENTPRPSSIAPSTRSPEVTLRNSQWKRLGKSMLTQDILMSLEMPCVSLEMSYCFTLEMSCASPDFPTLFHRKFLRVLSEFRTTLEKDEENQDVRNLETLVKTALDSRQNST